jgi:uncharacterized damage-inducible protein DinB
MGSHADAQRVLVSSHPSVFATVRHMVESETWWQQRLDGGPLDTSADTAPDLTALEAAWRTLRERRSLRVAVADPCAEVSFTLATYHHRGWVVTLFRQLGLQPPSLDWLGAFAGAF